MFIRKNGWRSPLNQRRGKKLVMCPRKGHERGELEHLGGLAQHHSRSCCQHEAAHHAGSGAGAVNITLAFQPVPAGRRSHPSMTADLAVFVWTGPDFSPALSAVAVEIQNFPCSWVFCALVTLILFTFFQNALLKEEHWCASVHHRVNFVYSFMYLYLYMCVIFWGCLAY